jgi:chemotaxis receptor (MCP) glutamine deamidase CheD
VRRQPGRGGRRGRHGRRPPAGRPAYGSTGVPLLLRALADAGARQHRLIVCAAGGAEILEGAAALAIGRRNRAMLRKVLWKLGVTLVAEATGGALARTMTVDLAGGEVRVRSREHEGLLWTPGARRTPAKVQP